MKVILSVPDEGYSSNVSYSLNLISTFLLVFLFYSCLCLFQCVTSAKKYELTRISVINEDLETVYDSLVKPHNKIVDYVTR